MLKAMANSVSGLRVHQHLLDVTAQNMANVNTVAFKERLVSYQELPNRPLAERRLPVANGAAVPPRSGRGAALAGITASFREASLSQTGRRYDLALEGEGFFRVIRPDGSYAYTRCGNFVMDEEGRLVTAGGDRLDLSLNLPLGETGESPGEEAGMPLELVITPGGDLYPADSAVFFPAPDDGAIAEEAEGIEIPAEVKGGTDGTDGTDEIDEGAAFPAGPEKIGEIPLYRFINPQSLSPVGENLLLPGANSGPPLEGRAGEDGFGSIRQGYLENSNVDLGGQMAMLIRGQRALQGAARTLTVADELWAQTLNLQV
ncbi:MAG: flagellar hook-basal body protein [Firmicutes bacterium]|nr:flagellar hook-basal body protein [Bacillota bacterium]